jgi:hypothetical protein
MSDTIDTISEKLHPSNLALSAVENVGVPARHRPHDYWEKRGRSTKRTNTLRPR